MKTVNINSARFLISFSMVILKWSTWVIAEQQVPAMFVFGDSLIDDGNNNYLLGALAKANFLPYGIDFDQGVTGRFTNGKTVVDMLGNKLGLPYLPAYADPTTLGTRILNGVNYASAAGGILDVSGLHLGPRFSLRQQVINFGITLSQLRLQLNSTNMMNISDYLAKSIVVMEIGSNDYVNNYLMPYLYPTSFLYNPSQYAELLISQYAIQLVILQDLGFRKFLLAALGPIGCIPSQSVRGRCSTKVNDIVGLFDQRLRSLVDLMNANNAGSIFVFGNTTRVFNDILTDPAKYGFTNTNGPCCFLGPNQGTCLPLSKPCPNRNNFVFWDAYHQTQAVNEILAERAYTGPPLDCYPINVQQMARM